MMIELKGDPSGSPFLCPKETFLLSRVFTPNAALF